MENGVDNHIRVTSSFNVPEIDSLATRVQTSFSDNSSQLDDDRCYQMQIEQLKRENNFLKKKIAELNRRPRSSMPATTTAKKRPSSTYFGSATQHKIDDSGNYILNFIDEITKLLNNFSTLFKIELEDTLTQEIEKQHNAFNQLLNDKKENLHRRLERMLLQPEEVKYTQLLNIFTDYYRDNMNKKKALQDKVQGLTKEAIELGRKMTQGVKQREMVKKSIKGSRILSVVHEPEECRIDQPMNGSLIKSSKLDEQRQVRNYLPSLGKEKIFLGLF